MILEHHRNLVLFHTCKLHVIAACSTENSHVLFEITKDEKFQQERSLKSVTYITFVLWKKEGHQCVEHEHERILIFFPLKITNKIRRMLSLIKCTPTIFKNTITVDTREHFTVKIKENVETASFPRQA